jgi:hypothetical protein
VNQPSVLHQLAVQVGSARYYALRLHSMGKQAEISGRIGTIEQQQFTLEYIAVH